MHVNSASEQIADLLVAVDGYDLGKLGTSLHDKLVTVQRMLGADKLRQACDNLGSFLNQVMSQKARA